MSDLGQSAWCIELAPPRERGLKPERGAERAAAERSGAALIEVRRNSATRCGQRGAAAFVGARRQPVGVVDAARARHGWRRLAVPMTVQFHSLDAIGPEDEPLHVARFGPRFDAQGVLAGTRDAKRCIGYLTKYLTKQLGRCHQADIDAQADHTARLLDALRYEPCAPTCASWLRYGITPRNPRPGLIPGLCNGKAHRAEHVGYAGRRVLTSRRWSGKTLDDHRGDRKAWLTAMLDLPATDPARYRWERVTPFDRDAMTPTRKLLHVLDDRTRWRNALAEARRRSHACERDSHQEDAGRAAA
jgi:hypothetical protein